MANTRPNRPGDKNSANKPKTARPASAATTPASTSVKPATGAATSAAGRRPTPTSRQQPPPPEDNSRVYLIGGLLLILVIGVVGFFLIFQGNSSSNGSSDIPIAADPTAKVDTFPSQGQQHINVGQAHEPYNSNPPTSGPHYPQPALWGVYNETLADEYLVHNLEHGGVVIQYDCPNNCSEVINQLSNYGRRYPREAFTGILVQPRKGLPDGAKIALTAWQNRMLLKSLDTKKIDEFILKYFNKGPESAG